MKIAIFLLYSSHNCLLYSCTTVYLCSCFFYPLSLLYSYLYLLYQSIFAHEKNTMLYNFKRLVHTFSMNACEIIYNPAFKNKPPANHVFHIEHFM